MDNTFVCNSKVSYIRPQFQNLKECLECKQNVYIGRAGIVFVTNKDGKKERFPKNNSVWANPYKVGKDGDINEVLSKYKTYILDKIENENLDILELKDKNLYCWCVNKPTKYDKYEEKICHGQILLRILYKKLKE